MRRSAPYLLLAILAFVCGILSYRSCVMSGEQQTVVVDKSILLERIRDVCKMVTVEGDVVELYNETQTRHVTLYVPFPTQFNFDKKATVQVTGTILVGYDLEGLNTSIDEETRKVTISKLPKPEVLAVDHQVEYRIIEESWFNSFEPADLTILSKNARDAIEERALTSELIDRAEEQGLGLIKTIELIALAAGYEFELIEAEGEEETEEKPLF
ncbi:MAG: DUF4230 domain-containing protein [Bacteroidota bacterium]